MTGWTRRGLVMARGVRDSGLGWSTPRPLVKGARADHTKENAMLQIFGFVYGLVTLIAGKFWLGKGRKAVGTPARIAGAVLVVEPFVAFGIVMILMLVGVNFTRMTSMLIELPLLIAAIIVANKIASRAATQQAMAQAGGAWSGQPGMQPVQPGMGPQYAANPYAAAPAAQGGAQPV